jgi:hypothetical protein
MVIDHQLNPDKYTKEQLKDNAYVAANAADAAAYAAADAAYAAANAAAVTYWINEYFEFTGENKQDYIDAINKDNKQ